MFYRLLLGAFIGPPCVGLFFQELSRQVYFTAMRRAYILVFTSLMLGMLVIVNATQQLVKLQGRTSSAGCWSPSWSGRWTGVGRVLRPAQFRRRHHRRDRQHVREPGDSGLEDDGHRPLPFPGGAALLGLTISLLCLYILCVFTAVIGGISCPGVCRDLLGQILAVVRQCPAVD